MPQESTPRRESKRTVQQMVVVGVIATAVGIAVGLSIHWFPPAASKQADKIDTLWDVLIIATVPIFVLVTVIVLFSVIECRMRRGEEQLDAPPIHGNTKLEVIWTALPAMLIVGLITYAYIVLHDIEKAPAAGNERHVAVTGQQFTWSFAYNEGGKKFTSPQWSLPVGESVKFDVRSKDVIHDFWVPDFRMKIDAVPGITTSYRVTPKRSAIGSHQIVCAELCGLGHAFMRSSATVMSKADFAAWVKKASGPAGSSSSGSRSRTRSASACARHSDSTPSSTASRCSSSRSSSRRCSSSSASARSTTG